MDTWEVVLILVLLTIAISVIAKHEVPLGLITTLDNIYFQLAILALTLGLATASPPVALVAVATIVIIYYIRNIVKIQMVRMNKRIEEEARYEMEQRQAAAKRQENQERQATEDSQGSEGSQGSPRIEITEQRCSTNADTIQAALQEHETRPINITDIGRRSTMGGMLNAEKQFEAPQIEMPNPRVETKVVESFDTQATFESAAPAQGAQRPVVNQIDSNIFSKASFVMAQNEDKAKPAARAFSDSAGQYPITEPVYQSSPEKYEQADFMPTKDMGSNSFVNVGISIDDKMTILKKGILPGSNPPPDYNMTVPVKTSIQ